MCLLRPIDPPKRLPKKGYKWMEPARFSVEGYRTPWKCFEVCPGEWANARTVGKVLLFECGDGETYDPGFHCFPTKRDALLHWSVKESSVTSRRMVLVEFEIDPKSIVAWGVESTYSDPPECRVFVAQRIKLIRKVEA